MNYQLYLCDLSPECADEQVIALLQPYGRVTAIEWEPPREGTDLRRAVVTLESDTPVRKVVDRLNRRSFAEHPAVVTPAAPPKRFGDISKANRRRGKKISAMLGETQPGPIGSITKLIHVCGLRFVLRMVKQAAEIEAAGGMMLPDGSRKRTTGGVFFYRARGYLTPVMHEYLFAFRKKHKKKPAQPAAEPGVEPAASQAKAAAPDPELAKPAASQPKAAAPAPESVKPAAPQSAELLAAAREQLAALREQHQAAQAQLEAAKKGQMPKGAGIFSLMKQVVDTQKAIDALLAAHPELKQ